MEKNKSVKIPVQLRVNMWLGLSAHEKKFNTFSEGNFSVYAELVRCVFIQTFRDLWVCVCDVSVPSLGSTKTRPRCLGSGEPLAWLVATGSQT